MAVLQCKLRQNKKPELKTPFDILATTEPWLESDNYLDFLLNDYEFCHKNRLNKKGGGVAIYMYVHKTVNFKMQKNMSMQLSGGSRGVQVSTDPPLLPKRGPGPLRQKLKKNE